MKNGMNSIAKKASIDELAILPLEVDKESLTAQISDGRRISIPIAWFSSLSKASLQELKNFEISPTGYGVHWPDLDEDISIKSFISP